MSLPLQEPAEGFRIDFDSDLHAYSRAGREVVGVTSVLGATIDVGIEWPESARLRGTAVHLATQFDDEGTLDEETVFPEWRGYLAGWRAFRRALEPEWLAIERRVFHPKLDFAGTLDRIARIGGRTALLDLKSGQKRPSVRAQLGGYGLALALEGIAIDDFLAVYVTKDGRFDILEVDPSRARAEWLAAFTVYQLQKEA